MLLLGIDLGTSSVKVSVMDANSQQCIATAHYPETEAEIISPQPGWAEQSPETWWEHVQLAILKLHAQRKYDPKDIAAIGIAYQMHGLVMVDKDKKVLRNSIIWCDSRAVEIGDEAFEAIGKEKCLLHLLNSPGNFTAAKLAWVKKNEPKIYERADRIMLPGDYIAMMMTENVTTSVSSLSEGIFWDFQKGKISDDVFDHWELNRSLVPEIKDVFTNHGELKGDVATQLGMKKGIPVSYKAGDQPNNALSLNVLEPGEVAATAGTSGVIYGVTDQLTYDEQSRVNSFAHVNHTATNKRIGVLLCINGTGIMNRWVKNMSGDGQTYDELNASAAKIEAGSEGLSILPFGNGAERMLNNKTIGAQLYGIDLNHHSMAHMYRATQEGIAFAFRYGLDIMRQNGMNPSVIRAGRSNMFRSEVFTDAFVNTLNVPVELYEGDGSRGAALGAGMGAGIYKCAQEMFREFKPVKRIAPDGKKVYDKYYELWMEQLQKQLN